MRLIAPRILSIGEVMVEISPAEGNLCRIGYAGDSFNTAWYLRHLLPEAWQADYFTALGDDAASDELARFIQSEGVGLPHVPRLKGLTCGLYMIRQQDGDRHFTYWRGQSAARHLADDADLLKRAMAEAGLIHISGITLAVLTEAARETLLTALNEAKARGVLLSFDPNIRPRLWESPEACQHWLTRAATSADFVFPSFEDDAALFGDASPQDTAKRYAADGAEVIVKDGPRRVFGLCADAEVQAQPPEIAETCDPTGAGDAFNAGYLAARLTGAVPEQAIEQATHLATEVTQHPGALIPIGNLPRP